MKAGMWKWISPVSPIVVFFTLVGLSLFIAVINGAAISFDGSYYLYRVIIVKTPFIVHDRYSMAFFHWPVVWAQDFTGDTKLLIMIFSLAYCSVPFIALILSWIILPDNNKRLFIWPALGITLACLPGQLFFVSESLIAIQLSWPILLAALVQPDRKNMIIALTLLIFIYFLHPISALFFFLLAVIYKVKNWRKGSPTYLYLEITLILLALLRIYLLYYENSSSYESKFLGSFAESITQQIFQVWSVPFMLYITLITIIAIALCFLFAAKRQPKGFYIIIVSCLMIAGSAIMIWASDPSLWQGSGEYRHLAFIVNSLFMVLALESVHRSEGLFHFTRFAKSTLIVSGVIYLALAVQILSWKNFTAHLKMRNMVAEEKIFFSQREKKVMNMICAGYQDKEIAESLGVPESDVDLYKKSLHIKYIKSIRNHVKAGMDWRDDYLAILYKNMCYDFAAAG